MTSAAPAICDLAQQILEQEDLAKDPKDTVNHADLRAFEKLRLHLSKFVGVAGFQALLARALSLSKAEAPWLQGVYVQADGTLENFLKPAEKEAREDAAQGCRMLLAQLLGLLVTFIGEALMLRLVQDVWPKVVLNSHDSSPEEIL